MMALFLQKSANTPNSLAKVVFYFDICKKNAHEGAFFGVECKV